METNEGCTETRLLTCKLSDAEVAHRADELAREVAKLSVLEDEKKHVAKEFAASIGEVEAGVRLLACQVRDHAEDRGVACTWQRDDTGKFLELVRQDTGEVVSSRALTPAEMQGKLFQVRTDKEQAQ